MFIDPEEFREQIVCAREQLKHLVPNPGAPGGRPDHLRTIGRISARISLQRLL
nr:hypothetical protein [Pseudomonas morbosilactucae]